MNAVVLRIDKPVEIDRKENLRDHRLYWIGRRIQDVILPSVALVVLSPVMLATAIAIVADDPRITRVGKFIRKTSLDELPQLWNILKGVGGIIEPTEKKLDFTGFSLA